MAVSSSTIESIVEIMLRGYGEDALHEARIRCQEALDAGSRSEFAVWLRVCRGIIATNQPLPVHAREAREAPPSHDIAGLRWGKAFNPMTLASVGGEIVEGADPSRYVVLTGDAATPQRHLCANRAHALLMCRELRRQNQPLMVIVERIGAREDSRPRPLDPEP